MMTIQQINEFKDKAKALGKSDLEINNFINQKLQGQPQQDFSPRPQTANNDFTPIQQPQANTKTPTTAPGIVKETGKGFLKGIGNTITNLESLGQKALDTISKPVVEGITGKPYNASPTSQQVFGDKLKPTNTAQKLGFYGEQVGEFFLPAGAIGKIGKTLDIASEGLKAGKLATTGLKIAGKAGVEAGANAAIRLGQTGSGKEAGKAGLTAGIVSGGLGVVGQALKSAKVPEWFYSKVFHNSLDDMVGELKSMGVANLQKSNPQLFKQLTDSGVIKLGQNGKTILNETLAKEALNRGLKGSIKNMASEVVKNTYELEHAAQTLTKAHDLPIAIEPQFEKILKEVSKDYKVVGFGEISQEANDILGGINNGQTTAENALKLRRWLDGMRIRSSFNPTAKLSQTQQNFKILGDTVRNRLATEVKGLKPVMNEYRFNIEALDALAREAKKRGDRAAIGLMDGLLFSSGAAGGAPGVGAAISLGRKVLSTPSGTTRIGSAINNAGRLNSAVRSAVGIGSKAIPSNQPPQNRQ